MAERGKFLTANETRLLIDSWSQDSIQKQLHGTKRNDNAFAQIVGSLAKCGWRMAQQCCAKIKDLKKKYKEIAGRLKKSDEGRESYVNEVPADFPHSKPQERKTHEHPYRRHHRSRHLCIMSFISLPTTLTSLTTIHKLPM